MVVSFVKEFCLQEEHLHSARMFFYPMTRTEQLPLDAAIAPGVLFTLSTILLLISRFIKNYPQI